MSLVGKNIVIIGLGLIGGSVAKGLRAKNIDVKISAVGRNEESLVKAKKEGSIDNYFTGIEQINNQADLILIAVPGLSVKSILAQLKGILSENTVVTDVSSVKSSVVEAADEIYGGVPVNFVPGHPIAGSENSGYAAAMEHLFENRKVILTPLKNTALEAINLVTELWEVLDSEVICMDVHKHDEVLAATSHLPHLLAFSLVDTLSQQGETEEIFRYAAGGFRDFTRIASSDPQMWHDIFLANSDATIKVLDSFTSDLEKLKQAIMNRNSEQLMTTFKRAKASRDKFVSLSQASGKANKE